MELADRFSIPIISFIDTPGAYPGVGAERRGQAEAIARSIECCMKLKVPTISIIIGEGGSGGAIALASSSKVIMLENAIYSVISPEGCATILWRDPKKMLDAAKAMKLSAKDLLELEVIDEIISEPIGGAHRDRNLILENIRDSISNNLDTFKEMSEEEILNQRKNKFLKIGRSKGFIGNLEELSDLKSRNHHLISIFDSRKKIFSIIGLGLLLLISFIYYKAPQQFSNFFPVASHFSFGYFLPFFIIKRHFGLFTMSTFSFCEFFKEFFQQFSSSSIWL